MQECISCYYYFFRLATEGDKRAFKQNCHSFFLEVVSSLCFGGRCPPEDALIKMLMDVIFTTKEDMSIATREMTHAITETRTDTKPVIRSSLLQLLLEHK